MTARFEVVLREPLGDVLYVFGHEDISVIEYTLKVNEVGRLILEFDNRRILPDFGQDYRLELWRQVRGQPAYLEGETCWFIDYIKKTRQVIHIEAESALGLLKRRIVAFKDGEPQTKKGPGPLDDLAKEVIRENMGAAAASYNFTPDPIRDLSAYFQVQADLGVGLVDNAKYSHEKILDIVTKAADASKNASPSVPFYFDVVQFNNTTAPFLEFRVYTPYRGSDRTIGTPGGFEVSEEYGTLTNAELIFDWRDSVNRLYAGGSGTGNARDIEEIQDPNLATLLATDPFALREDFIDAKKSDTVVEANNIAKAEFEQKLAVIQVNGELVDTDAVQYGRDYFFGDAVSAGLEGTTQTMIVGEINNRVADGSEDLKVKVSSENRSSYDDIIGVFQEISDLKRRLRYYQTFE